MELSIIIINWNSKAYVLECIHSIYTHTKGVQFEIIVLDNASYDGCGEMLAQTYPSVRFMQNDKNLGFSRGNNFAARHATGDFFLFLNPDTEVQTGAIDRLYKAILALPDAGVIGARLLNSDGTLQTSCLQAFPTIINQVFDSNLLRQWLPSAGIWGTAPLYSKGPGPFSVEGISGACLMTPREVFQQVGGFSENYFMYYEDMDYCLKARKKGRRNYYVSQAKVVHHGGKSGEGSSGKFASVMMVESAWRFFWKEHGRCSAGLFRMCLAANALFRSCLLAIIYPLPWRNSRRKKVKNAFRKWAWITRWAFGVEHWVADY